MNSSPTILAAAAVSLLLNSAIASADQRQFSMPSTEQAQRSAELLQRTADGFYKLPLAVGTRADRQQISDLWLFPTSDPHTVFARYTEGAQDSTHSSSQHLSILTVEDHGIIAVRELTDAQAELTGDAGPKIGYPSIDGLHWSAAIGTGHALDATLARTSAGLPASADWTARIGTGTAALSAAATQITAPVASATTASAAQAHWSSKIGTGRASEPQVGVGSAQHAATIAAVIGVER